MIAKNIFFICIFTTELAATTLPESFDQILKETHEMFKKREYEKAVQSYKAILVLDPTHHQAQLNLGISLFELKKYTEAEQIFKSIISKQHIEIAPYLYLGKIAQKCKKSAAALEYFNKAVTYDPTNKEAVYGLTEELKENLRTHEAISHLRIATAHHPHDINLEFTLANTLNMAGYAEEALAIYIKLNTKHPNDAGIIYNIAYTLKKLGRMEECLPHYEKSLRLKPDHTEALFSQGLAYLVLGDWERGWKGYEERWTRSEHLRMRTYSQPVWNGEDLQEKTIFVYAEQGLGDTFQFLRYLTILKERGARIVFAPQRPLMKILTLCPYIDEIILFAEKPAHFDYHVPLVSLPYILKTRIDSVPAAIPYLYADAQLVEEWRLKLAHDTNFKVGICWQGNSEYTTAFLRAAVAGKSIPVQTFEPLTHIPGVTIYSLQHTTGTEQLNVLPATMKLTLFDGDFDATHGRFMDTAAVIKNLDLVITVDTSICHFAAALGTPVWNLLPNPPDWRWMLNRIDTPWYPNMKLFRQATPGDWHGTMQAVVKELRDLVATKTQGIHHISLLSHYYNELALVIQHQKDSADPLIHDFFAKTAQAIQAKIDLLIHLESME